MRQSRELFGKTQFVLHAKHTQRKINESTLFTIDNMYYVNFRIYEQESVPWCGEIQNQMLEVLGNTFNFHSNSTYTQELWSLNQFNVCVQGRIREWLTLTYTPFYSITKFCMFLSLYITNYLIGLAFWAIPIRVQYVAWCGTEKDK